MPTGRTPQGRTMLAGLESPQMGHLPVGSILDYHGAFFERRYPNNR
jgi:hypothetical protein